ncbi:MAG: hypothetical protein KA369_22010 [Spirochaetes bacterium]|nr:hypothetical protein [Spirochaetota bacterium]
METTLNIDKDILNKMTRAAQLKRISRTELIVILMNKVMGETMNPFFFGRMVQYQEKRDPGEWHKFHIILRPDEYEFFLDLRKLLKMSVSHILAFAVERYLSKLINEVITDNYLYKNYVMIRELINNIQSWKLIWGYPPDIKKHVT